MGRERGIACIRDGQDTVPIIGLPSSLTLFGRWAKYSPVGFPPVPIEPVYSDILSEVFAPTKIVFTRTSQVSEMVLPPLTKFLTVRFEWAADNPEFRSLGAAGSARANNPYLPFTVHTKTSGLRIHYSKTFAINFNNVFGAPTTPINGWIMPGIHKFAGIDGNGSFHYDPGSFTTPPDFSAQLMI